MSWHCKKISLLISAILLISTMAGCRARHFPLPPPIVPGKRHYENPPPRVSLYRYRYFPYEQVYYDHTRDIYFYFSNNVWWSGPVLPRHIHIDINNYVIMELEGPKPYLHHKDVIKRYPPRALENERRHEERHEERREERGERRDDRREQRQEYRDEDGERRDDRREQRQEYRDEDGEGRDDRREQRQEYRDEDDEELNNKNGKRQNDQDNGRGAGRSGWRKYE